MKKSIFTLSIAIVFFACNTKKETSISRAISESPMEANHIEGTWKLFYGDIREGDSLTVKDLSNTDFIKIINKTHFAFFNQSVDGSSNFYGGGGTYTLDGNNYAEKLNLTSVDEVRGHIFPFTIEIKGDTLIQQGLEEVKEANMKRYIMEKYVRIKN